MLKATMSIIDDGIRTKISVEQQAKVLFFKKNRRSSPLEITQKCQISKLSVARICDACSEHAS